MRIELMDNWRSIRSNQRRYPLEKRKFMHRVVSKLESYGFIKPTTKEEWVAATLVVPKPPPVDLRLTIYLWPVNAVTKPMTWPMPNMDGETGDMPDRKVHESVYFPSNFWKLCLHEYLQHFHAFMTDKGFYMPTRTFKGGRNSAQNFQGKFSPRFDEMGDSLEEWIEDFAIQSETERNLSVSLQTFFRKFQEQNLKGSARITELLLTTLQFCGRFISPSGVPIDPRNVAALTKFTVPINAGELCEYFHCI